MQQKFFQRSRVKCVAPLVLTLLTFFIFSVPASAASSALASQQAESRCLAVSINMSNPRVDVIIVNTSVRNLCNRTVTNVNVFWFTTGDCNGRSFTGPSDKWRASLLNIGYSQSQSKSFFTICYSNQIPYFPVFYKIQGRVVASATYVHGIDAIGDAYSPTYIFH